MNIHESQKKEKEKLENSKSPLVVYNKLRDIILNNKDNEVTLGEIDEQLDLVDIENVEMINESLEDFKKNYIDIEVPRVKVGETTTLAKNPDQDRMIDLYSAIDLGIEKVLKDKKEAEGGEEEEKEEAGGDIA